MATLKKLKINLEYEDRVIASEIPPYKTLKYIKTLAKKLFYIKNADIQLIYMNKDITGYENYLIGDFFKRKNQISIKIISLNINSKSTNNIKMKRLYILDKSNFKCICNRDLIANYCRNCKEFICNSCRINQVHINHKIIQVDTDNLVESVKLYALTLQNDISVNIKTTEDNNEKYNVSENNNNDNNDIGNRHELIKEKFDNILNVYNNCIDKLNVNNDVDQVLDDYKNETNYTNEEIEKILKKIYNKYTKGKKIMTYDEFKNYFKLLSEKEEELLNKSNDIISFRVNDDLKDRMKLIYDKIEQILDYTINSKNPLGVSNETNYLYNLVLKNKENNEDNETNENYDKNNENNENNEENENKDNNNNENNEENENQDKNNDEESENSNNESEDEDKKLNDIIDKNDLQKKEKNDLITMGVLDGNKNENNINNEEHTYVDHE